MVYFYYFILPMSVKLLRIKAKMNHFLQFKKMISRRIIFVYIVVLFYLYQHCKDNVETIFWKWHRKVIVHSYSLKKLKLVLKEILLYLFGDKSFSVSHESQ